jgi:AcrR family transcriptional regulator
MKLKDPEKVELIYAATLKIVRDHNLTALNMATIGKEAKLGMGTIYGYFKSKDELINSLFKKLKGLNLDRIYAGLHTDAPFKVNMKNLVDNYINNRINQYAEHYFVEQCANSHYLDSEAMAIDQTAYVRLFELLDRGKAELLVKDIDNALLAAHMVGSANELVNICIKTHRQASREFLDQAFLLCWDGIKR